MREAEEEARRRGQLEQERRDHELALRLAQESNSQVDDIISPNDKYLNFLFENKNTIKEIKHKYCLHDKRNSSLDIYSL